MSTDKINAQDKLNNLKEKYKKKYDKSSSDDASDPFIRVHLPTRKNLKIINFGSLTFLNRWLSLKFLDKF